MRLRYGCIPNSGGVRDCRSHLKSVDPSALRTNDRLQIPTVTKRWTTMNRNVSRRGFVKLAAIAGATDPQIVLPAAVSLGS